MATIDTRYGYLGRVCDATPIQQDVTGSIGAWLARDGIHPRRDVSILVTESVDQTCDDFAKNVDIIVLISCVPQTVQERVLVTKPEYAGRTVVDALAKLCEDQVPVHH